MFKSLFKVCGFIPATPSSQTHPWARARMKFYGPNKDGKAVVFEISGHIKDLYGQEINLDDAKTQRAYVFKFVKELEVQARTNPQAPQRVEHVFLATDFHTYNIKF